MASKKNRTSSRRSKDADIKKRIVRACQILGDPSVENLFWYAGNESRIAGEEIKSDIDAHMRALEQGSTINPPKYVRTCINSLGRPARKGQTPEAGKAGKIAA